MDEYIVVYFSPFNRNANFKKFEDKQKAKEFCQGIKKNKDCVIVKKEVKLNRRTNKNEDSYIIEKYGYYRVYDFLYKILFIGFFMLIIFISYLYFKFKNKI